MADTPRPADLPPGYDSEDPYDGENLSTYPDWWQRNIETFKEYDMRPYRPSRFADDKIAMKRIDQLEAELDVRIIFRAINPDDNTEWELLVDGKRATTVPKRRESEGFTRYLITADEFESQVRGAVET